jgi:hypothetical protein
MVRETSQIDRTQRRLGVPRDGKSPQKIWVVGSETRRRRKRLTSSAFNLPQFTQIHSKIFLTFTMKPESSIKE